jgi:hypothetical protein
MASAISSNEPSLSTNPTAPPSHARASVCSSMSAVTASDGTVQTVDADLGGILAVEPVGV